MNAHDIPNSIDISYAGALVTAASNTDSNSSRFDMANYEGVIFFTTITDSAATGVATLTIEENSADSDTGMTAITGSGASKTCTVNDDINNMLLISGAVRPAARYVQGVRTSATANIAFGEIHCIRFGCRVAPIADNATVADKHVVANV